MLEQDYTNVRKESSYRLIFICPCCESDHLGKISYGEGLPSYITCPVCGVKIKPDKYFGIPNTEKILKLDSILKCSSCGKPQGETKKLVAGPGVYICDECIALCDEIVQELVEEEKVEAEKEPGFPPAGEAVPPENHCLTCHERTCDKCHQAPKHECFTCVGPDVWCNRCRPIEGVYSEWRWNRGVQTKGLDPKIGRYRRMEQALGDIWNTVVRKSCSPSSCYTCDFRSDKQGGIPGEGCMDWQIGDILAKIDQGGNN